MNLPLADDYPLRHVSATGVVNRGEFNLNPGNTHPVLQLRIARQTRQVRKQEFDPRHDSV